MGVAIHAHRPKEPSEIFDKFCRKVHKCTKTISDIAYAFFIDPEGMGYFTDTYLYLIDPLERFKYIKSTEGLKKFTHSINCISNLLTVATIISDVQYWVCREASTGKYIIEKSWQKIAEGAAWTIKNVLDFIYLLELLKPDILGVASKPLGYFNEALKVCAYTMGIWVSCISIYKICTKHKFKNLPQRIDKWRTRQDEWAPIDRKAESDKKIAKWGNVLKKFDALPAPSTKQKKDKERAKLKLKQWICLKNCTTPEIINFCKSKKTQLKDMQFNKRLKLGRNIASIALSVAAIALIILSLAVQLTGIGGVFIPFLMIGVPIVLQILDTLYYLVNAVLLPKKLKELDIPS